MRLLLDTQIYLWYLADSRKLSTKARAAVTSADEVFVSAASAWEIAIKARIGKLDWPAEAGSVNDYVIGQGFRALPISLEHAERAGRLAIQHRDPFDRMLIAQALAEDLLLVSNETLFDSAGVRRHW